MIEGRRLVLEYDRTMKETKDWSLAEEANEKICSMTKQQTISTLNKVLDIASNKMKNGFQLSDN